MSDGWMLTDQLRREPLPTRSVLDVCPGSGPVAVTAALHGASSVTAADVSWRALLSAWLNALLNMITANPPYVPSPSSDLPQRDREQAWEA
jgi:release factor glutamine methyltransferase